MQTLPMMFWPQQQQQKRNTPLATKSPENSSDDDERDRRREIRREENKQFSSSYKTVGFHIKKGGLPISTKMNCIEEVTEGEVSVIRCHALTGCEIDKVILIVAGIVPSFKLAFGRLRCTADVKRKMMMETARLGKRWTNLAPDM